MKRKITYIIIVLTVAVVIAIFSNGCGSPAKEIEPAAGEKQGKTQQEETRQEQAPESEGAVAASPTKEENSQKAGETASETTGLATNEKKYVTITVNCATIYDNMENFDKAKKEILPEDGLICPPVKVEILEGETVFDVLLKVTRDKEIHMEYVSTPLYKSNYIEGIGNIYEIDCGPLSGWMYKVNDWFPNYGCGRYVLEAGDRIEWIYTCDLGRDIGGDWNEQNK